MRGVSPIIAEVLLVAVAIAASVAVYSFVTSTQSSFQSTQASSAASIGSVLLTLDSVTCSDNNLLTLAVRNEGTVTASGLFSLYLKDPITHDTVSALTFDANVPSSGITLIHARVPGVIDCKVPGHPKVIVELRAPSAAPATHLWFTGAAPFSSGSASSGSSSTPVASLSCSVVFGDPSLSSCYRREVTVKNNTSSDLNDYTVMVDLDTNTLIQQGKLQPDCNDIRFVLSDGTDLNYWVENCGDTNTHVWVKIPEIPASGEVNVYLYYGDASAMGESNGERTFLVFDDFSTDPGIVQSNYASGALYNYVRYDLERKDLNYMAKREDVDGAYGNYPYWWQIRTFSATDFEFRVDWFISATNYDSSYGTSWQLALSAQQPQDKVKASASAYYDSDVGCDHIGIYGDFDYHDDSVSPPGVQHTRIRSPKRRRGVRLLWIRMMAYPLASGITSLSASLRTICRFLFMVLQRTL